MTLKVNEYVSCIKIFGESIVPPLMTNEKRQEMKDYKEKAMAFEQKIKGKRISLDSGVMTASTEMQKIDSYDSPTNVLKEPDFCDEHNSNSLTKQCSVKTVGSIIPEIPTIVNHNEKNNVINLNDSYLDKKSIHIKSENISLFEKSCDTFNQEQDPVNDDSVITNSDVCDKYNSNNSSPDSDSINMNSESISLDKNSCDTLISKQESAHNIISTNCTSNDEYIPTAGLIPRVRSSSYTLSSPSPVMVAYLNSQIQKEMIEPKCFENNIDYSKECKSDPSSVNMFYDCDDKTLETKSISFHSIPEPFINHNSIDNLVKYRQPSVVSVTPNNAIISEQNQDENESLASIGTKFSNDESVVDSVKTVFNGSSYENNSSQSLIVCKSKKQCSCRLNDDYSLISSNMPYKTSEELNLEAERLRLEKIDIERRHQEEVYNLLKKHREEQEQITVKYCLISQSPSGISLDDSECSEFCSKQSKCTSPSILSDTTATNNRSVLSDMSIVSNCSTNKNFVSSSPRLKITSHSPYLRQNIKLYHRMRDGLTTKWIKAPSEVENAAATVINASVRGYLTRRLLRTEKAQMLKKTILDSLKTALIMHMELKKQKPTESDLDLHRRIINQLTTACYDLNDLILGSVQERMSVIRGDRELVAVRIRRKSNNILVNKPSQNLNQPKKSVSSYSLARKTSMNAEKRSCKK